MSYLELKKNREAALAQLNEQLDKLNPQKSFGKTDDRFWSPTVDKSGNGYAVIRFLPAPDGEDAPFIRRWDHGFKGPAGKWYINLNRNSIGEDDPVSDFNSKLWQEGEGSKGRKTVTGTNDNPGTKRRLHYIANVLIIEDPDHPENNGKIKLFKFGKKIFDKLNDAMNPKFKDESKMNPFDMWTGANFKIKIRNFEGYRNYDKSEFSDPAPLSTNDSELETIYNSTHSLQAFLDPKLFGTYEELQKKLNQVMDPNGTPATRAAREEEPKAEASQPKTAPSRMETASTGPAEDDDESLEFFKKLV